jgi:hypothetical protein
VKRTKRYLAPAACLALALAASPALAEADGATAAAARDLAVEGRTAYAAGDYARACDLFHRAYEMVGAPTLSVYQARSLARLGRMVEAIAVYRRTLAKPVDASAPEQFHRALADAGRELADLESRVPTLAVSLKGPSASDASARVSIDGTAVDPSTFGRATPLDPGAHRVELSVEGRSAQVENLTLAEGVHRTVELSAEKKAPEKPSPVPAAAPESDHASGHSPLRTWAYVSLGVGVAGIGTGIVAGVLAGGKHSDAEQGCPNDLCEAGSEGSQAVDSFRTLRLISTIGYAVGAAATVGGVTLFLLSPSGTEHRTSSALEVWAGPGRAGLRGRF